MIPEPAPLYKEWKYEFEHWRQNDWFEPVKVIAQADTSESYEMDRATLFQNKNGSYVVAYESGCSCYEPSSATLELFKSMKLVKEYLKQFDKDEEWMRKDSRKALLRKLMEKAN